MMVVMVIAIIITVILMVAGDIVFLFDLADLGHIDGVIEELVAIELPNRATTV
jgi:hypothetical protein